jgi:hypothetical protein
MYPPPKTHPFNKFSGIYIVFHTFLTLRIRAFLVDQKLLVWGNFVATPPFPKYIGFKIQDPESRNNVLNPRGLDSSKI